VVTNVFTLSELLDWLEALLDHRAEHRGQWFVICANDERYVELHITEDEIWAGGVTNYNLSREQWLTDLECRRMQLFGWALDAVDSAEPKYVRTWPSTEPTTTVVSHVLRVFTSIYLGEKTDLVEVVRGTFADDHVDETTL
jgi:hypothetical protein